jgi:leucyl/phenylalanyl-tRNA--protein transferase
MFPEVGTTFEYQEGLIHIGGELNSDTLLEAYSKGIFPWYSPENPPLWWSPDPRFILYLDDLKVRRSLSKRVCNGGFEVKFDQNFRKVIQHCRDLRESDTWIVDEVVESYSELHRLGYAHSVESYLDGELVGGLYGVSLGNMFFGESMFSLEKDASKVALVKLVEKLKEWNFSFIDAQIYSEHLESLGAKEIPRADFLGQLKSGLKFESKIGDWSKLDNVKTE